jgi:hypothetical protein
MIVLSVGMPRAGSGWYFNLIQDLVISAGGTNSRQIRSQYHLEDILTEVNCNISALTLRRVTRALVPSLKGENFTLKAHSGPTVVSDLASSAGWMKISYIYRDPRDALLSAMDFGRRTLEKGQPNAFSHLTTLPKAIDFMLEYCEIWENWMKRNQVLHARYEDLLTNYEVEAGKLVHFLAIDPLMTEVKEILEKYRPGQAREAKDGLHFFKGQIGRFREKFSTEEQALLDQAFGPFLDRMGYAR